MPHCISCTAPLPAYSASCEYCGVNNDVNLQGIYAYSVSEQYSSRNCPVCRSALDTITIDGINSFAIERCGSCYGLFFDPDELDYLLDSTVDSVYRINMKRLWSLNQVGPLSHERGAYVKCPVCSELMNRVKFGVRSGVVVDQCKHGVWLDNGGLRKLLEWRKAGGELLHEKVIAEKYEREHKKSAAPNESSMFFSSLAGGSPPAGGSGSESAEMLWKVVKLIGKLFVSV